MLCQGFATGDLDEDAFPIRHFCGSEGFEAIVCQSFSKNMGLYNERAGCVSFVTKTPEAAAAIKSQLAIIVRHMYSNPPAHGAQVRLSLRRRFRCAFIYFDRRPNPVK